MISSVPPARAPIAGNETVSREWYRFFQALQVNLNEDGLRSDVDDLTIRVSTLEHDHGDASSPISIRGAGSVYVSLSNIKMVSLVGDSDNPSTTAYYGTDATGGKGWYPAPSLLAGASTDDLAEGGVNSYFHDAPADGAAYARKDSAWSPITGTAGGTVTSVDTGTGITGGPITGDGTISLDSASIDALALALTSLQSITQGNGITVDNADPTHPAISAAVGMGVPYLVASGETYAVPLGIQTLWTIPIELEGTANLDVSGHLVEVA